MPEKLTPDQLKSIVSTLKINQPVMSYRVVGNRVELRMLGGSTAVFHEVEKPSLDEMSLSYLRTLAASFVIPGRAKMSKKNLLEALLQQDPEALQAAINGE